MSIRTYLGKLLQNLGGLTHIRAYCCIEPFPNSRLCTGVLSPERRSKPHTSQLFSLTLKLHCVPYNCLWPCVYTFVVWGHCPKEKYIICLSFSCNQRAWHVLRSMNGENKTCAGKSQDQRSLERPRCQWKDNIKMNLRQTGHECVDWPKWLTKG